MKQNQKRGSLKLKLQELFYCTADREFLVPKKVILIAAGFAIGQMVFVLSVISGQNW